MLSQENNKTFESATLKSSVANKLLDAIKNQRESAVDGQEENFSMHPPQTIFAWSAPEYIQHQKSVRWYMAAAVIALIFIIIGALTANWTMILAIVVFAAVYEFTQRFHPPKIIDIQISELGIHVGHMLYPYSSMQAFWIIYKPGLKTLNIRVHGQFYSDVVIQLMDQDPAKIRQYLVGQVPEWEGKDERLQEIILRLLKL